MIEKKIQRLKEAENSDTSGNPSAPIQKADIQERDLLSLLIKANLTSDVSEHSRMTDDEIVSRKRTASKQIILLLIQSAHLCRDTCISDCWI